MGLVVEKKTLRGRPIVLSRLRTLRERAPVVEERVSKCIDRKVLKII